MTDEQKAGAYRAMADSYRLAREHIRKARALRPHVFFTPDGRVRSAADWHIGAARTWRRIARAWREAAHGRPDPRAMMGLEPEDQR